MEQIVHERIYPEPKNATRRLKLSPYLLIVLITLIGFAVVSIGTRALAQYAIPPLNPFPAYADVFPGQPESAVKARAFLCVGKYTFYYLDCTLTPAVGDFVMIEIVISNGIIHRTSFLMRDNTLRFGDLEKLVGTTDFKANRNGIVFSWYGATSVAMTFTGAGRFSLFHPVWNITFTETG